MKVAIIIAYVLIAILVIIVVMQYFSIKALVVPASTTTTSVQRTNGSTGNDGSAAFEDTLNALKEASAKSITLTF